MRVLDRDEISRLTEEYGGTWGISHTRRLLHLVSTIGEGLQYNAEAVWLAAHLHDWGGYPAWEQKGVDHAARSRQVAEAFLAEREVAPELAGLVLECIAAHHSAAPCSSVEAALLRDADALDFLGVVGIVRDFAKKPKDLRAAYETTRRRRQQLPGCLQLDKSKSMAAERVQEMDAVLSAFEAETFGYF